MPLERACTKVTLALCLLVLSSFTGLCVEDWNYDTEGRDWPLTFPTCGGLRQSPINLASVPTDVELVPLRYDISQSATYTLFQLAHTIQVQNFAVAARLQAPDRRVYRLRQFHFHIPSEHAWGSSRVDLEMHLVHVREGGSATVGDDLLVICVGFVVHGENLLAEKSFWDALSILNTSVVVNTTIDVSALLPIGRNYITYTGSLTTPPCTEGVHFYVMEEFTYLSESQFSLINATVRRLVHGQHATARALQAVGGRLVTRFVDGTQSNVNLIIAVVVVISIVTLLFFIFACFMFYQWKKSQAKTIN